MLEFLEKKLSYAKQDAKDYGGRLDGEIDRMIQDKASPTVRKHMEAYSTRFLQASQRIEFLTRRLGLNTEGDA